MRKVSTKFSGIYKWTMKQKRIYSVIASVVLHIILVVIIGLLFTEHYWIFDEEAIDVNIIRTKSQRNIEYRTHRSMSLPTPQQTFRPQNVELTTRKNLPQTVTTFNRSTTQKKIDTDVLSPDDVPVPNMRVDTDLPDVTIDQDSAVAVPTNPSTVLKIKPNDNVVVSPKLNRTSGSGFTEFLDSTLPQRNLKNNLSSKLQNPVLLPQGQLGGILTGTKENLRGHIRIIRLKHSLSDWWQDPTAIPALMNWMDKHTAIRADMSFAGGALPITDPRILDAPLIIMTGHDKDITAGRGLARDGPLQERFTPEEHAAIRKYIVDEGGMLFFDDCGFHGLFAQIVAEELQMIFPEYPLEIIPHEHEIYSIHYQLAKPPTGGDVFWGNENNAQPTQFRFQKGITIDNRLAVIYNRKDYLCAMETAEIESRTMLRLRRSPDVYRFMTNLLVYALKYGGNTDRSGYKE